MKITVWTLAWDTDLGTGAMVLPTEEAALAELFDMAVADHVEPHDLERVRALFWEDPYDVVAIYKPEMDTFIHESHTVEFSLMNAIRETFRAKVALALRPLQRAYVAHRRRIASN